MHIVQFWHVHSCLFKYLKNQDLQKECIGHKTVFFIFLCSLICKTFLNLMNIRLDVGSGFPMQLQLLHN
jgi:hypothetical protein